MYKFKLFSLCVLCTLLFSCSKVEPVPAPIPPSTSVKGFYLLNEGAFGFNNASLDYFDLQTGTYYQDFFSKNNPDLPYSLGDVATDILLTDNYLIIVLNNSNFIEVADRTTSRHITQIDVPNCRYVIQVDDYLYVTSYGNNGSLYKISLETLSVVDWINVGYEPEQLHFHDGLIYVLNSGGYHSPDYAQTISIVDLDSFSVVNTIDTGYKNLYKILCIGDLEYITSRGDYGSDPGAVFSFNRDTYEIVPIADTPVSNWCFFNGTVYTQSTTYGSYWNAVNSFGKIVDSNFSLEEFIDCSSLNLQSCYCLDVNPVTGDFIITDAGDYTSPGVLYYFSSEGTLLWSQSVGIVPSKIAWVL